MKLFCWHKWIYKIDAERLSDASWYYRDCEKCGKKQKAEVLHVVSGRWKHA